MHGLRYFFSSCANYVWLSSLAGESRASAGQATRGWGLPGTTCTDDFSMWRCSWVLESVIMAGRTQNSILSLCAKLRGSSDSEVMFHFPDNGVTLSEPPSSNELRYVTGKIWEPEVCVYNNTITAQAWQMTCHHPQQITASWLCSSCPATGNTMSYICK